MDWQTVLLRDSMEEALKEVTSMGLDMPSNQSGPVGLAFNRAGNLLLATSEVSGPLVFGFDGCTAMRAVAQSSAFFTGGTTKSPGFVGEGDAGIGAGSENGCVFVWALPPSLRSVPSAVAMGYFSQAGGLPPFPGKKK